MTLHGSKGLEFPAVFIVAVEQGKLPHERSREDPQQLEEERRLLFVGITRAQQSLTLSYAKYRDYRGQLRPAIPSSFLMELPRYEMNVSIAQGIGRGIEPDDDDNLDPWENELVDDFSDKGLADDAIDFDPSTFENELTNDVALPEPPSKHAQESSLLANNPIVTASSLAGESDGDPTGPRHEPVDPNAFAYGMRVKHPDYGLGKIVALSGEGKNRTATVNFVMAGEKKFILIHSLLHPA
jgi:DNA helicase-2/ATP-dependent DNA helicase PcrA